MARFVKPLLGRPRRVRWPARSARRHWPGKLCAPLRRAARAAADCFHPASDDELGGLRQPVVRDRGAAATLSASGIIGTFLSPRTPGSAYILLHHYMGEIDGEYRAWGLPVGGTGAISRAIAEAASEARRRVAHVGACRADHHDWRPGNRCRARFGRGDRGARGRLERRRADDAGPAAGAWNAFRRRRRRRALVQVPRIVGQGQLRARRAADFQLRARRKLGRLPRNGLHLAIDRLSGAGVRRRESTGAFPGSRTSTLASRATSIPPSRRRASTSWPASSSTRRTSLPSELGRPARGVRRHGPGDDREIRARSPQSRPPSPGPHAARHRAPFRTDRGQHLPGRAARSSSCSSGRPLLGAGYATPVADLWLCGSSTHPGGAISGAPGRNAAVEVLRTLRAPIHGTAEAAA